MTEVRRLPLHADHARLGAKFMQFAGWEVPLQYTTIVEEHQTVRQKVGIFDVSHMGKFVIKGEGAFDFLETVLSNGLKKIGPGRAIYSLLLNDKGGVVDDVIVYEFDRNYFFMIVNAATSEKDFRWLNLHRNQGVELIDESPKKTILAVQGPQSERLLTKLFDVDFGDLKPFHFRTIKASGTDIFIGATGYTGERGFEIVNSREKTAEIFQRILEIGKEFDLRPVGFGARDTLRLEAAYLLYGQDMDDVTSPLEAGLEWVCDFSKDFIGRNALLKQKREGLTKKLVGFEVIGNGVARHGYEIIGGGVKMGEVTSGTFSPTLHKSIGLAYVPMELASLGSECEIAIRDKHVQVRVTKTPFYNRNKIE